MRTVAGEFHRLGKLRAVGDGRKRDMCWAGAAAAVMGATSVGRAAPVRLQTTSPGSVDANRALIAAVGTCMHRP